MLSEPDHKHCRVPGKGIDHNMTRALLPTSSALVILFVNENLLGFAAEQVLA